MRAIIVQRTSSETILPTQLISWGPPLRIPTHLTYHLEVEMYIRVYYVRRPLLEGRRQCVSTSVLLRLKE